MFVILRKIYKSTTICLRLKENYKKENHEPSDPWPRMDLYFLFSSEFLFWKGYL